jgi:nucleoside-diphosphate-sugar epimerase
MQFKKILITGGAGYCGSVLTPQLLDLGYEVVVYDIMYYGDQHLPKDHPKLTVIEGDIRDTDTLARACEGVEAVIHLACISNDTSFDLDEALSTSVNMDAFEPMVIAAKKAGVKRFIYASSSSVYGISEEPDVTEDHPLLPLTLYNKYKGLCEPLLSKHTDENFTGVVFRPATVCGYGPRQRLDVSVNILTNFAVNKGEITVFGGSQLRPNLHIQDYCDLCQRLLELPNEKIADGIYNCGFQNMSIMDIALVVKKVVEAEFPDKGTIGIVTTPSDDIRSYHINSDKIARELGFKPTHTIEDAVRDLCQAFRDGKLPDSFDDDVYYNVRTMKAIGAK